MQALLYGFWASNANISKRAAVGAVLPERGYHQDQGTNGGLALIPEAAGFALNLLHVPD